MIVITGSAGFIASFLAEQFNKDSENSLILVDDFSRKDKEVNHKSIKCHKKIDRSEFLSWFKRNFNIVDYVIHLGARTDTTEMDYRIHESLNVKYSKEIWSICSSQKIPLIYASSAATYGMGENGYKDDHDVVLKLAPLNPYGESKNNFDKWVLNQKNTPPYWAGLKFFNVYGPNEGHKGRMASVILHTFNQIEKTGGMKLFRSHHKDYKDGEQLRDFIYVKDVISIIRFLYENSITSGLYNVGTGNKNSFMEIYNIINSHLKKIKLENIPFPNVLKGKYQFNTIANIDKLRKIGYKNNFTKLKDGIINYSKTIKND